MLRDLTTAVEPKSKNTPRGVIIISGITGVILFIKKKSNKKNLIVLVVVTILAICFIMFTDFQSKDSYYNGKDKAYIFKKVFNPETQQIEKEKIEVCVGKRQFGSVCSYYLFDKKAKIELGYITIREERGNFADSALSKDYPEYGIIGARINIDFVENVYPDEYSGVGEVADQIALEHCIKENMPLQIVSTAEKGSVIAHYKRGRKFFPVEGRDALRFIVEFGTNDPNKIIEERIKQNPDNKNIYCDDILGTYMYMPKEVVAKYLERIKENPILH